MTFAGLDLNDKVGRYPSDSRHPTEELLNSLTRIFIDNGAFDVSRWIIVAKRDYLRWPLLREGSIPWKNSNFPMKDAGKLFAVIGYL